MREWPYFRPISVWCKDRPAWCDFGAERDPLRMLARAIGHITFLTADLMAVRHIIGEKEYFQESMILAQACVTMLKASNEIHDERIYGQAHSPSVRAPSY